MKKHIKSIFNLKNSTKEKKEFSITTLTSYLDQQVKKNPNKIAYTFLEDGKEVNNFTFKQLKEEALKIAVKLQSYQNNNQNKEQPRALLLYPSGLEFITAFLGCLYAGVIAVPAYPPANERMIERLKIIIDDCQPDFILTNKEIESGLNKIKFLQKLSFIGVGFLIPKKYQQLKIKQNHIIATDDKKIIQNINSSDYQKVNITSDYIAFLQYTSGSTSNPKGVVIRNENLVHNIQVACKAYHLNKESTVISWLPIYHDMGLVSVIGSIIMGYQSVFMSPIDFLKNPYNWLKAIDKYKGFYSASPNFGYDLALRKITDEQITTLDLSSWKVALNGAEPVRVHTLQNFAKRFKECGFDEGALNPSYGMAEATVFISTNKFGSKPKSYKFNRNILEEKGLAILTDDNDPYPEILVSHGDASLMDKVFIVNEKEGKRCKENEVGEIWVKDQSIAKEYWQNPQISKETFQAYLENEGPFLRTGDLGFFFDNRLFIAGRLKDLIIIRGKNFYPQDLEKIAERAHKNNRKGCVVAFSINKDSEEQLVIVQEVTANIGKENFNEAALDVKRNIANEYEILPYDIVFIKARTMNKTTSGKVQRNQAKQDYLNSKLNILYQSILEDKKDIKNDVNHKKLDEKEPIKSFIKDYICNAVGCKILDIKDKDKISELGLDSISIIRFCLEIENHFHIKFPLQSLTTQDNILDIVNKISAISKKNNICDNKSDEKLSGDDFITRYNLADKLSQKYRQDNLYFREVSSFSDRTVTIKDPFTQKNQEMLMFGSNNYLGLGNHPYIKEKVKETIDQYGSGLAGPPILNGYSKLHQELEQRLAKNKGAQATMLFSSGYSANIGLGSIISNANSLVIYDQYAHASFADGLLLGNKNKMPFAHNDVNDLEKLVKQNCHKYKDIFVAVEGLYSMDGDIAKLDKINKICKKYKCFLVLDEAHSSAIYGKDGHGLAQHFNIEGQVDITMGTFSKALAITGGFLCASEKIINYFRSSINSYIFSASLTPSVIAAALAGLDVIENEPQRRKTLFENVNYLKEKLKSIKVDVEAQGPIFPILIPKKIDAKKAALKMHQEGIFINSIMYPAVERGQERFRASLMANHTKSDIDKLVEVIDKIW